MEEWKHSSYHPQREGVNSFSYFISLDGILESYGVINVVSKILKYETYSQ
ncbi:hypothetical protein J7E79_00440 [Bacillus sp. ISL-40]|nr:MULTISPECIES: hypothetical protein [unclassified Bacillus (in: firmicutes)]MBT2695916.1 hypothetical protein [Bacillus sp. ISL-40]MBT2739728.1 hypothetical protein [Bacillus sp. ISL-77]